MQVVNLEAQVVAIVCLVDYMVWACQLLMHCQRYDSHSCRYLLAFDKECMISYFEIVVLLPLFFFHQF